MNGEQGTILCNALEALEDQPITLVVVEDNYAAVAQNLRWQSFWNEFERRRIHLGFIPIGQKRPLENRAPF